MKNFPRSILLKWLSASLIILMVVLNSAGMAAAQELTPTPTKEQTETQTEEPSATEEQTPSPEISPTAEETEPPPTETPEPTETTEPVETSEPTAVSEPELPALGLAQSLEESDPETGYHPITGKVTFLGATFDAPIQNPHTAGLDAAQGVERMQAAGAPENAARAFLAENGGMFGLSNPAAELALLRESRPDERRSVVRFQQQYRGVPVLAGELVVQMDAAGSVVSVNGEILPGINLSTQAQVAAGDAANSARLAVSSQYGLQPLDLDIEDLGLWIYSPALLSGQEGPAQLVWRMEVRLAGMPLHEIVLVDAHSGEVALQFNQAGAAEEIFIYDAEHGTPLLGTFCDQACLDADPDAKAAFTYASNFYSFFSTYHGRDSIDDAGLPLLATVNYGTAGSPPPHFEGGAFWTGASAYFGDASTSNGYYGSNGYSQADDIVAHEFVHGLTDYTSGLFNYYQSGAIAESLADLWGEFVDLSNGRGDDSAGVRWLIGEDNPGSPYRSMSSPPTYGQPDKITSSNYYTLSADNGGVHTNSGVNNKAVSLLVDGGSFNGYSVTGIGITKVSSIYYEAQTNLLVSGSDYLDLKNLLYQSCRNLLSVPLYGGASITSTDCNQVNKAVLAVEMDKQPATNPTYNLDVALCPGGENFQPHVFLDDFEVGISKWTLDSAHWKQGIASEQITGFAHSGLRYLYADDYSTNAIETIAAMTEDVVVPINGYLHFYHAFILDNQKDGGVIEYSTNGGANWQDAASLIVHNGYKASLSSAVNPLNGRSAFTGDSHGYISTQLNLAGLAGQSIRFRWRLGTDNSVTFNTEGKATGWWVDDVRIYYCNGTGSWAGGAIVFSDAAVVTVGRPHMGTEITTYDGFNSGGTVQYLPMLFKNIWGNYDSAVYIQNLDTLEDAEVRIEFYEPSGALTCSLEGEIISPMSSVGYWLPYIDCTTGTMPASWYGSAVVTSTNGKTIVAVGRPHIADQITAYDGMSQGFTKQYVPMLFKNAWGYDAALYVQNVDTASASIRVDFYDTEGNLSCSMSDSIPQLSSVGYWIPYVECNLSGALPSSWYGSAVVTSLNAMDIISIGRPHLGEEIMTYTGFASGATEIYLPMLFRNMWGSYNSAMYIQNLDETEAATINIALYDADGNLTCKRTGYQIEPMAASGLWLPGFACNEGILPYSWYGSAVITSTNGKPLVAIGRPHIPDGQIMTYNGFLGGQTLSYVPMLFRNIWGYNSALYVQNVDAVAASVRIEFYNMQGELSCVYYDLIESLSTKGYWLPSLECSP